MNAFAPDATSAAAPRSVCQSTARAPRALPPAAVLSGTCAEIAPVPAGLSAIPILSAPAWKDVFHKDHEATVAKVNEIYNSIARATKK
jgi:hypothetical protein